MAAKKQETMTQTIARPPRRWADAGFGEVDEALGYLRLVHDVAGEDEVGDGQQHEFAHRGAEHLRHGAHDGVQRAARALDEHGGDARDAEADGYRRAHYEKQGEAYEQYGGYHFSMGLLSIGGLGFDFRFLNRSLGEANRDEERAEGDEGGVNPLGHCMAAVTMPRLYWFMTMSTP